MRESITLDKTCDRSSAAITSENFSVASLQSDTTSGCKFYVASCVFTEGAPDLSRKVQNYVRKRFNLPIIRCCVDKYKVAEFEQRMPENYRDE